MLQRGFSPVIILLILAISLAFFFGVYFPKSSPSIPALSPTQKKELLAEKIKGSKFHSPDATWWGYNQSKIVRFKNKVFTYYIDNDDDSNKTTSKFVILKKDSDGGWEQ